MSATIERSRVREPREAVARTPRAVRALSPARVWPFVRNRTWAIGVLGLIALVGGWAGVRGFGRSTLPSDLVFYSAQHSDLPINVTERGNLESQQDVQVLCEVDDINGDGMNGTLIVWIVPNGASVSEGDLLVELDSSMHVERLDRQIVDTERARSDQIQGQAKYDNQLTQNETLKADAELQVKLAELELKMFSDQESGTHQLEVEEIQRSIDDINSEILSSQANLELKQNDKQGIESLFKLGYAGKNELDRSRLEFLQAEGQLAAKMNRLRTQMATLTKKETYEHDMQLLQLQGKLETSKRSLAQVLRDNEARLAQAKAVMDSANESLKKQEELLARYREQVDKCKIRAPQDGMVAYATGESWRREEIREGAAVRPRQVIMTLPNLTKMQVKTAVHESVLDKINQGLRASIKVDAFPDRTYQGTVDTVAVLPDQSGWMSSDTKVYTTTVKIDEEVKQLKPGMTAVVEIHVDKLEDVLNVPIQAVVQEGSNNWCYVGKDGNVERRPIGVGRTNDKFVEITSGLAAGERVVLNPMSILEKAKEAQKQGSQPADEATAEEVPEKLAAALPDAS